MNVSDAEQHDQNEPECQSAVDKNGLDEDARDHGGRVVDFFAHVDGPVESCLRQWKFI